MKLTYTKPNLARASVSSVSGPIIAGAQTVRSLIEETLQRIAEADPAIFIKATPTRALEEASASDARQTAGTPLGPLDGVPISWKALFDMEGEATSAGSLFPVDLARSDAELVARLKTAGAVTVGIVNMSEFAFSGLGMNPHFGTPLNPWGHGEDRLPGGSSSGSAVAVASGLVPISFGTDTSGSVRVPAAMNGIVGYKTSFGRWPSIGISPLSESLDTPGVLVTSVHDVKTVDDVVMHGRRTSAPNLNLGEIKLLVPENAIWAGTEMDVQKNFSDSIGRLASNGVRIIYRHIPELDEVLEIGRKHGTLVAVEAYALHCQKLISADAQHIDPMVRQRLKDAGRITRDDEHIIRTERDRLIKSLIAILGRYTFIACPTVPVTAPLKADLAENAEKYALVNSLVLRNTMIGSYLNWCGISIPNGLDTKGLPTGFLISGAHNRDDELIAAAGMMEPLIRPDIA